MWSRTLLNDFCNETQLRALLGRFILTDEGRNLLLFPRDEPRLATCVFRGVSRASLRTRPRHRVTPGFTRGLRCRYLLRLPRGGRGMHGPRDRVKDMSPTFMGELSLGPQV